jgi:site-specific recombinase XerD
MPTDKLEQLNPETAKQMYLRERQGEVSDRTLQAHHYRLEQFIRWCDRNDVENLNDLTGRDLHQFRLWRKDDGDLNTVSLRTQLQTLRVFTRFCETIDGVSAGLSDRVRMPEASAEEERSRAVLPAERAHDVLEHLRQFEYASLPHVVLELLWHTGIRMGAAHALDVPDYDSEGAYVAVRHRPETETALKNAGNGERLVALSLEVCEVLDDWIDHNRPNVTDERDRRPLLATRHGRLAKSSLRGIVYRVSRPCYYADHCPHGRDVESCEGTDHGTFSRCPSAVSPHAIRRGSITYHLTNDVPERVVSDRMNVSQDVLEAHYDERTEEQRVEQRRGFLDNI